MDSSIGPKGRVGEFTLDYGHGIINTHEEVFLLGLARGIIEKPNQVMYKVGSIEWKGKEAILTALRDDADLRATILRELKARDMAGLYAHEPVEVEAPQ